MDFKILTIFVSPEATSISANVPAIFVIDSKIETKIVPIFIEYVDEKLTSKEQDEFMQFLIEITDSLDNHVKSYKQFEHWGMTEGKWAKYFCKGDVEYVCADNITEVSGIINEKYKA